jgi:hypothetical protein
MESEWEFDRMKLYQLWRQQPKQTQQQLAEALKRSLSWVKKWIRRFKQAGKPSLAMFKSLSRAPRSRKRQVVAVVRQAILGLRDTLKESYNRVIGPLPILYHLHKDPVLQAQGVYLPRSSRTIWKVLKEGGRIPTRVREHYPLLRPDPLQHWEMDFGQMSDQLEFLNVVDRGTSILVDVQTFVHYNAETALQAVARLLVLNGCPQKLRFDNDPRFVGSWQADGFPSPLMRFLLCLGVQPDLVPPGKPQEKPFAERSVRTVKHECFYVARPEDWLVGMEVADTFRYFYNHDRANQSSACGNRPPFEAFPILLTLPSVPETVDPDAWLAHYHGQTFKRQVGQNGMVSVGKYDYYVGYALAREKIAVWLDATHRVLKFLHHGAVVREHEIQGLVGQSMSFQAYLQHMLTEARTSDR